MYGDTMVTQRIKYRRSMGRWKISPIRNLMLSGLLLLSAAASLCAGDFNNSGAMNNTGKIRVKNGVSGLPDSLGGVFEYFGGTQTIQAITYDSLSLTGDSIKTAATTGTLAIFNNVSVASAVTLSIPNGQSMRLDQNSGRLTENGIVHGKVTNVVNFIKSADSSDFGGIGLSIRFSGTTPPGTTQILRYSGSAPAGAPNALTRYYTVTPADSSSRTSTVLFNYNPADDVPSGYNSNTLELWRSVNNGATWRREHTIRSASQLQKSGNYMAGIWTASDTLHLLGRKNYEGDPDSMSTVGPDSLRSKAKQILSPFIAKVTDVYGNTITNAKVRLSFSSVPAGANGYAITDSLGNILTSAALYANANGYVKVGIKLGNVKGSYKLLAQVDSISSPQHVFTGFADASVSLLATVSSPSSDSVKATLLPIVIKALDSDDSTVSDVNIKFQLVSAPAGATTQSLVSADSSTNASGQAKAVLRLGQKSGLYTVKVSSTDIDSVKYYNITAIHGKPTLIWQRSATVLTDTIGSTLGSFVYALTDIDTNAVSGANIRFNYASKPSGSSGDSLIIPSATTDVNGEARANVRLGTTVGTYIVNAADTNLNGSARTFTAIAMHGKPVKMNSFAGVLTDTIGAKINPFGIRIADRASNFISGLPVKFTAAVVPIGARSTSLSVLNTNTDSTGSALTQLTLGSKTGIYGVKVTSDSMSGASQYFTAVARHGVPMNFAVTQGSNQSKTILQPLDTVFTVGVTDRALNAVSGDTAYFRMVSVPDSAYGQSLSAATVVTDSLGFASTRLTLGSKVGSYVVSVTASNLNGMIRQFTANAIHGTARYFAYKMGTGQSKSILSAVDTALTVKVTDIAGNAIQNYGVHYLINSMPDGAYGISFSASHIVTDTTILSDAAGSASAWLKLGSKVGLYDIAAVGLTSDTVHFRLIGKAGPAFAMDNITGTSQMGRIGDQLGDFSIHVADIGGNSISGDTVKFKISSVPNHAIADTLSAYASVTDANGLASTKLTLGSRPGIYTVTASVSGVRDTSFSIQAIMLLADANGDNRQNIGDLTAVIDHITGKKLLTGYDFLRADIYPTNPDGTVGDGVVDYRDLYALRDSLLNGKWDPAADWLTVAPTDLKIAVQKTSKPTAYDDIVTTNEAQATLDLTYIGARFGLTNTVPVKGIQSIIYLKQSVLIDTFDVLFGRANMMTVNVKSIGNEIHVVAFNLTNNPILPDTGALFRLPLKLNSVGDIDSIRVFISSDSNAATMAMATAADIKSSIPQTWQLYQNYPNPFNPSTTIQFDVPEEAGRVPRIAIQIFNILGQKVKTIERGNYDAGRYRIVWDGTNEGGRRVASGVYFYRILAGDFVHTMKMVLIK
jgi:hypothetical protein